MKIGIDISQIAYQGTGTATYTQELVRVLCKFRELELYLFGSSLRRQEKLVDFLASLPDTATIHSKLYSLPQSILTFLWNSLHVGSIENFIEKVDVFHTSDWLEPKAKAPKVTTIHDLIVYKYPEFLPEEIVVNQKRRLEWVKKESAAIIADSQSTKEDIMHYLKIPAPKIHVIYLGVDKMFYKRSVDEINQVRKKYRLPAQYFLSVGTREPRKNLEQVIKAYSLLNNKEVSLAIAGNYGWGEDVALQKGIKLLGFVDQNDLPALYSGAEAFVYPSIYEGFGLPVLEALACGAPVVTSNRGSLGEIADKIAIEVDPENAASIASGMSEILSLSNMKRKLLVKKGIAHSRKYTWEETARKTVNVYKSVI
ncbi:glycosyltransferase family 1 protein [Candidatus Microgenomates bacterium]|nr:MAG: glycosyltransferase family 1 protein [Candidatus Microgenomates bacterium]